MDGNKVGERRFFFMFLSRGYYNTVLNISANNSTFYESLINGRISYC